MAYQYRGIVPYRYKSGDEWSGNANGRPKGSVSLTKLIRKTLTGNVLGGTSTDDGRTVAEWLVDHMIKHAMKGNAAYMKEVMDRNDGAIPKAEPEPELTAEVIAEMEAVDATLDEELGGETPPDITGQVP